MIPEALLRRPKSGFGIPINEWFSGELRDLSHDYLLGERACARGCFRPEAIRRLFKLHDNGAPQGRIFWMLMTLEEWRRQFVDRQ